MINGVCHCGSVSWELSVNPDSATACNCTVCRRYATLWAYGYENVDIRVSGKTNIYQPGDFLGVHFCASCGCVAYWRANAPDDDGQRRIAVNLRLAEIADISDIRVRRFDGLNSFQFSPDDGQCVIDYWP